MDRDPDAVRRRGSAGGFWIVRSSRRLVVQRGHAGPPLMHTFAAFWLSGCHLPSIDGGRVAMPFGDGMIGIRDHGQHGLLRSMAGAWSVRSVPVGK